MLWQKDHAAPQDDWVTRFTVGDDYRWDTLLLPYDIEGCRVQAWGLRQIDLLSGEEYEQINTCLDALAEEVERGVIRVTPEDEDSHTVIETYLTEALGEAGKKIHAGRSRNDQVLVALRLFLRDHLQGIARQVLDLGETLCRLGERHDRDLMPGYTHFQRAMPTTAGHWALGYAELLTSDLDALRHAHAQVNVGPMGSAAGYGVPHLDLPRAAMAERLGFRGVQVHAPAVQLSRGKLELHAVHALVQLGATANRLASDLVLFNTAEYGFVELPAAYCTGSSIMPQKQNPDVLELARASYHRLLAEMQVLLSLPANLPSGYHRDLQGTKAAVMRAVLLTHDLFTALQRLLPEVRFRTERMQAACSADLFATEQALRHVQAGMPFREAYREVARGVDDLERPSPEETLAAYEADGTPGHGRPDLVREALARHAEWAAEREDTALA